MSELARLRTVLVYNQPKQKFESFQTSTDKWADIAELIKNSTELEVDNLNNMRAVLQSNQSTLELPNATIPNDSDQKIFLFEAKVKSGAGGKVKSMLEGLKYNDLRKLAKEKGIVGLGSNPVREDLITALEKIKGITKVSETKTSVTGKTRTITKKVSVKPLAEINKETEKELSDLPNFEERLKSVEEGFAKLIHGLAELTSDYIAPKMDKVLAKVTPEQGKIEAKEPTKRDILAELNKEASKLTLRGNNTSIDEYNEEDNEEDND
jgi:hypothetical protein